MSGTFRALSSYNYRVWFAGGFLSNLGTWATATTQAWVVLSELTDNDAFAVGVVIALQWGPQLFLVPVTGAIVDRFPRRAVIAATQSLSLVIMLATAAVLLLGVADLWQFYLLAFLFGIVTAIDTPARQSFIPVIVSEELMANAIGLNVASVNISRLVGPAAAGLAVEAIGAGWVFLANAVSFLGPLAALLLMRTQELRPPARVLDTRGRFTEGMRYLRGRHDLMAVIALSMVAAAVGMNFPLFTSTMAVEFGQGAAQFGLLATLIAVGAVAGALVAARRSRPRIRWLLIAAAWFGVLFMLAGATQGFWWFAAVLVLVGFAYTDVLTTANGYVLTASSAVMRTRMITLYLAFFTGSAPAGALLAGWLANEIGPRGAIVAAGGMCLAGAILALGWLVAVHRIRLGRVAGSRWRLMLVRLPAASDPTSETAIPEPGAPGAAGGRNPERSGV